ncbi:hypothetical protein ALC53_09743 [Atta colombica]|uniref:Uncharacterized protein n=1 Tax=Atta colombica TaxID=520822 RepID=A0A195B5Q9_9HYME|nr:hypothetical protein ALC53_09743 [Atta colombica]
MQAVYIISVTRLPLIITIEIEANLYKLAHTTSMLTANWKAIIFANLRFTIYAYLDYVGHMRFSTDIPESQADSKSLARVRISSYHRQRLQSHRLTYLLFAPATLYCIYSLLLWYSMKISKEHTNNFMQDDYINLELTADLLQESDVHVSGCQHPLTAQSTSKLNYLSVQLSLTLCRSEYTQNIPVYTLTTVLYDIVEYSFIKPLFMYLCYYRNTKFATARNIIFMRQDSYNICHAMGNLRYSLVKLLPNHVFVQIYWFKWLLNEITN